MVKQDTTREPVLQKQKDKPLGISKQSDTIIEETSNELLRLQEKMKTKRMTMEQRMNNVHQQ